MSNIKSMYAIAKLKKSVKPFSLKLFKEDALKVYEETCQVLAEGDQSRLRQVSSTPSEFLHNTSVHLTEGAPCLLAFPQRELPAS